MVDLQGALCSLREPQYWYEGMQNKSYSWMYANAATRNLSKDFQGAIPIPIPIPIRISIPIPIHIPISNPFPFQIQITIFPSPFTIPFFSVHNWHRSNWQDHIPPERFAVWLAVTLQQSGWTRGCREVNGKSEDLLVCVASVLFRFWAGLVPGWFATSLVQFFDGPSDSMQWESI